MRLYYVNPANTSEITGPYQQGQTKVVLPDGRVIERLTQPIPEWDVYGAVEDPSRPPNVYYTTSVTTSFVGAVKDPSAYVQETNVFTQIPIDELEIEKTQELQSYARTVFFSNCVTQLNANWRLVCDEFIRTWYDSVSRFLQERMADRVYGLNGQDYWARDVPISAININTGRRRREPVNESQWKQVMKDIALHDFAAIDALELCQADIDAAHGAGDWEALAAIDVTESAYGWPPVYDES